MNLPTLYGFFYTLIFEGAKIDPLSILPSFMGNVLWKCVKKGVVFIGNALSRANSCVIIND